MRTQPAYTCAPSSVSDSERVVRCNRRAPMCFSRRATWRLTAEVVMPSWRDAAEKPPQSTTLTSIAISFKSSINSPLRLHQQSFAF